MKTVKKQSLCYGSNCCPEARVNEDGSVSLVEGVFTMTIRKESAEILAKLLVEQGYLV